MNRSSVALCREATLQVLIDGKRCFSSVKCIRASSPAPINPTVSTFLGAKYLAATHPTAAVRSCVQTETHFNPATLFPNKVAGIQLIRFCVCVSKI